jgi:SSS family solute:Na+ symporter
MHGQVLVPLWTFNSVVPSLKKTTWQGGLAGMLVGGITVLAWVYIQHPFKDWYEMIPGFILSLLTNLVVSTLTYKPDEVIESEFEEVNKIMQE